MTRISSYRLYQCSNCGQKHINPIYGSVNLMIAKEWPKAFKPEDLLACQCCSIQKPLKSFIPLGILDKPAYDSTPKWFRPLRKLFDRNYKEPDPHPMQQYPDLASKPFDSETYFSGSIKKYMDEYDAYPAWFKELTSKQK